VDLAEILLGGRTLEGLEGEKNQLGRKKREARIKGRNASKIIEEKDSMSVEEKKEGKGNQQGRTGLSKRKRRREKR